MAPDGLQSDLLVRILEISQRMAEMRALPPLLHFIPVDQVVRLVGAERGYVVLVRPDGSLDFRVTRDQDGNDVADAEDQISISVLQQVMQSGEPMVLRDAVADLRFSHARSVVSLNLRSIMCVPLICGGDTIGAIYVENRSVRNRFKVDALSPLRVFAD